MIKSRSHDIKREQKKSYYLRELSNLLHLLAQDEPRLGSIFITRVELSADTGICYLYCSAIPLNTPDSPEKVFRDTLSVLILYKPSLRAALAKILKARYVPDLVFLFDDKKEKVDKINELLDKVGQELSEVPQEELNEEETD